MRLVLLLALIILTGCSASIGNGLIQFQADPFGTREDVKQLKAFDAQVLQAFKAQETQLNEKFEALEK